MVAYNSIVYMVVDSTKGKKVIDFGIILFLVELSCIYRLMTTITNTNFRAKLHLFLRRKSIWLYLG